MQEIERPSGLVIPELRSITAPLSEVEVRDEGSDGYAFIGYAATFDRRSVNLGSASSPWYEVVKRGAFRKALDDTATDVRLLLNHDPNLLLARQSSGTLELREDTKGLRVFARIAPTSYGNDVRTLIQRGDLREMSFQFRLSPDSGGDKWVQENGELVRYISSFDGLVDGSIVAFPAYPSSRVQSIRSVLFDVPFYDDEGNVRTDDVLALAERIQSGELEADPDERASIDCALSKSEAISPWMASRALPPVEVVTDAVTEVTDGGLDLRRRKLAFIERHGL